MSLASRTLVAVALLGTAATLPAARPAGALSPARQAVIRAEIEQLNNEYIYDLDHERNDKLADLFVEMGVMENTQTGMRLVGREAIRDYYAKRSRTRATRHVVTNLYFSDIGADHAHAIRYLTYFAAEGAPPLPAVAPTVAEFDDLYRRGADGRWRYEHRMTFGIFGGAPPVTTKPR